MEAWASGGGSAGELVRAFDWSTTPLGALDAWPASLKTIVGTILHTRHPMFLWWGPELIQIYNDAYIPSFGRGRHPAAMGQRGRECWSETWAIIGPQIEDVMERGIPSWHEDQLVPIYRNDRIEEVYWTYGYCPVFTEDGSIGGTLVVCTETTGRVVGERRLRVSCAVAEQAARATERAEVVPRALAALTDNGGDVRYALAYRWRRATGRAELVDSMGLDAEALRSLDPGLRARVEALAATGERSAGPFTVAGEPTPVFAVVAGRGGRPGDREVMVFGLNPGLAFADAYRDFLVQIAAHVGLGQERIEALRARAAAEGERNNLLAQAPVATALLVGPQHVFLLANPMYCRLVGRAAGDLVGRSYREVFPELEGTALPGVLDRVFETGERFVSGEALVPLARRGDGRVEECFFKFNLEPIRDADGRIYGMMSVAVDITEQVVARRALEREGRAKDQFLAMLGHELRNPLGAIAAAVRVLSAPGGSDRPGALAVLRRQVDAATRLLDDLLDVARITRGRIELRAERVDLSDVARRAVDVVRPVLEAREHTFALLPSPEPLVLVADAMRVEQVLVNLLTNAAKYTAPGGRVGLSLDREGDEAVVRVTDTGAGISADVLPYVFDLFVQAERTLDRAQGGLGIGLTLVRGLVSLHGGSVRAHSAGLGEGSEFVVRLPLGPAGPAVEAEATVAPPEVPAAAAGVAPRTALRVLLVDDNADLAAMMVQMLTAAGHEVTVARDGFEALAAARACPDVVLLDLGLPGLDGFAVARDLRQNPSLRGVLLIALSGYGQLDDRARTRAAGFDHHLVKPVDFDALFDLLTARAAPRPE